MICAEHLTKIFGGIHAVDDVTFAVRRGEVVGFVGPNGAGKTTTLRMLAGVFAPSAGRATIAGYDVVADAVEARRHLGYFPERIALYLDMTVRAYLDFVAAMKEVRRTEEIDVAMEQCGITEVAYRPIGTLSKGYHQRVGLAQALIGNPEALLLDEPTAGLDPEQVADVRKLVRSLARDRAILLSTHVLSDVQLTCDRVVVLHRGRVLAEDSDEHLDEQLRTVSRIVVEAEAAANTITTVVRAVAGVRAVHLLTEQSAPIARLLVEADPGRDVRGDLVQAIIDAGCRLLEIRAETRSLEDTFLALLDRDRESS